MKTTDLSARRQIEISVREELLPGLSAELGDWDLNRLESFRGKLHALHAFAFVHDTGDFISLRLCAALDATAALWELLEQNEITLCYLRRMETIRTLDLGANLAAQSEIIRAEAIDLGEFAAGAIASGLGWFTDTLWVELARMDHHALCGSHAPRLQDLFWQFIRQAATDSRTLSLQEAQDRHAKMTPFFQLLRNPQVPSAGRFLLLWQLYLLLVALNLSAISAHLATPPAPADSAP
jgi:hypothetical protein